MMILSEDAVRQLHLRHGLTVINADKDAYITQQAKDYIREKNLTLLVDGTPVDCEIAPGVPCPRGGNSVKAPASYGKEGQEISPSCAHLRENRAIRPAAQAAAQSQGHAYVGLDGSFYEEKPEHMTHLYANVLVAKNHPRILFRGKLDSLEAMIIELQVLAQQERKEKLVGDLGEVLSYVRQTLSCEVKNQELGDKTILGLDETALRQMSHHPKEQLGIGHLLPDYTLGALCAKLNSLRTQSREAEIAAVNAFCTGENIQREDILQGMNRLSSAIYILMLRLASGYYEN